MVAEDFNVAVNIMIIEVAEEEIDAHSDFSTKILTIYITTTTMRVTTNKTEVVVVDVRDKGTMVKEKAAMAIKENIIIQIIIIIITITTIKRVILTLSKDNNTKIIISTSYQLPPLPPAQQQQQQQQQQ